MTASDSESSPGALAGIRVVDLSRFLPAGYCTMVLADFGADVIRIEQAREVAKQNAIFGRDKLNAEQQRRCREQEMLTRNKRSVLLNLREPEAMAALLRMIEQADVLIHDYRQENIAAMGLTYDDIRERFPALIYCGVSLCGNSGPYQGLAGHDPIALALSGALSRFGGGEGEFAVPGLPVGDLSSGMQAVIGILLALRARDVNGAGQYVDVAMSDCALALMTSVMQRHLIDGKAPPLAWSGGNIGLWKTADGKTLCTTDLEPAYWEKFCRAVDRPDLIPLQFDAEQAAYRESELKKIFAQYSRDEWFERLRQAGTQVAPAYELDEALNDPHARARGTVTDLPSTDGETVTQVGPAIKLSGTPGRIRHLGPMPGDDSENVLREFGFGDEEISRLL